MHPDDRRAARVALFFVFKRIIYVAIIKSVFWVLSLELLATQVPLRCIWGFPARKVKNRALTVRVFWVRCSRFDGYPTTNFRVSMEWCFNNGVLKGLGLFERYPLTGFWVSISGEGLLLGLLPLCHSAFFVDDDLTSWWQYSTQQENTVWWRSVIKWSETGH